MILIVLVGNIGTGKTTFSKRLLNERRVLVCPDDYKGSIEFKQNKMEIEIKKGLKNKKTVIIDGINATRLSRRYFLEFSIRAKCKSIIFDFGPGNYESLLRRTNTNSELTFSEWEKFHLINQKDYEKPSKNEGFDKIIELL